MMPEYDQISLWQSLRSFGNYRMPEALAQGDKITEAGKAGSTDLPCLSSQKVVRGATEADLYPLL
jgi:hypothetical protein